MKQSEGARRRALRHFPVLGVLVLALGVAGCAADVPTKAFAENYDELVAAFRAESAAVEQREEAQRQAAVRRLEVVRETAGERTRFLVSADLDGASVDGVVRQLLEETQVSYNMSGVRLNGTVTARFGGLELAAALNEMLNAQGISVAWRQGMLDFRYGAPASKAAAADGAQASGEDGKAANVEVEVALSHMTVEDALSLLQGLYSGNDAVSYGALPNLNTVYLAGAAGPVANARTALLRADRKVPHVFIETLVVDLDTVATKSLGARLTDGAAGDFSDISILPGSTSGNLGFSLINGLKSPTQLTLMIDMLVSEDSAEILSRPYLATRSNQAASIEIVTDQYVAIQQSVEGASITTTDGISAGVILNVTPVVQADGMIRLDMSVEESTFSPAVGGALVLKERNAATTTVSVPSGRTVVIGGLDFARRATAKSGLPVLRNIPGLNLATANEESGRIGRELVVYMTPRIWDPQIDTPLIRPDLPSGKHAVPFDEISMRSR